MKESVVNFGEEGNLVGMLSAPLSADQTQRMGIVFLNAGLMHKVGPYREWVDLSRRFVALGYSTFRFDISGLGDSELPSQSLSHTERARIDIAQALNLFEKKTGITQFILIGLCAGADYAHPYAFEDRRVRGLVLIDGFGYQTPRYHRTALIDKWFNARRWTNRILRLFGLRRPSEPRAGRQAPETYVRDFAACSQVREELKSMALTGTHFLCLYTSGVAEYYNYKDQFWDMFAPLTPELLKGRVESEFYPLSSHTFTFLEDREKMYGRVLDWVKSRDWA